MDSVMWAMMASVGMVLGGTVSASGAESGKGEIAKQPFGKTQDGVAVDIFTLRNARGMEARISNYGGLVVSLKTPDREGKFADVVLGYDKLEDYFTDSPYFGAMIGRYGNRIAKGKFTLNGVNYTLAINNGPNALHGGLKGFDKVVWQARPFMGETGPSLELKYVSRDMEEGFPGTLSVTAVYTLTEDDGLRLDFTATTDKDTIINLTQHSYFNLAGKGDVLGHEVWLNADAFTPTDRTQIPTGELRPVAGTPMDFRKPMTIGSRVDEPYEQLKLAHGYDHNFVVNKRPGELGLMARVAEPVSGRVMEVLSTEPGVQFYTANFLKGTIPGKGGWMYAPRNAFCLEPQHFPDSPNQPKFPPVVLKPGETYRNTIIYRFSVK